MGYERPMASPQRAVMASNTKRSISSLRSGLAGPAEDLNADTLSELRAEPLACESVGVRVAINSARFLVAIFGLIDDLQLGTSERRIGTGRILVLRRIDPHEHG